MAIHMTRYKGKKVQGKGEEFMEELRRMVAEHKARRKEKVTQYKDKLNNRREELIEEQMDKTWTSIYSQWDKRNPNAENYRKTIYASGREVTQNHDSDWNEVTYQEPMRRWVFKQILIREINNEQQLNNNKGRSRNLGCVRSDP